MPASPDNEWTEMSRRIFLRRAAMTSITASTSAAFLAACGSSAKTVASATTAPSATTAAAMVDKTTTTAGAMVDKTTVALAAMAELEGTINFLNFPGWVGKDTYSKFAALHPKVKVNEIPIGGSENSDYLTKIKDRAGDYDLILVDGTTWPTVDAVKGFGEFAGKVPNIVNVDSSFRKQLFDPTDARWAATDYGRTGIGYRKDIVKEPITSWKDFLAVASKYKGKVAVLDYQRSVMGSILRMLGKPSSTTSEADIAEVVKVLKELKPNLLAISTEVGKQLATGEIVMAFGDAYDVYAASLKEPNIGWVDPSEGQVAYIEGLAVLKGPRDDLSRALIDFHLSKEAYADFVNTTSTAGVMGTNEFIKAELLQTPVLNPTPEVKGRIQYHQFLGEAKDMWQRGWDEFKGA
jgi:spermidine/putrescine transport system substrate-binding protein